MNSTLLEHTGIRQSRLLWLAHERFPHPEAVSCPAEEHQVRMIISRLNDSHERRMGILQRLKSILEKIEQLPPIARPSIPARMPNGLYEPISWRLALWLSRALDVQEASQREALRNSLKQWLTEGSDGNRISISELQNSDRILKGI